VLFAVPLYLWGGRKDANPLAFYLLLFPIIPPLKIDVPILITVDNYTLLSFFVLVPALLRFRRESKLLPKRSLDLMDWSVIAFGVLQTILFVVPDLPGHVVISDSTTNLLRRAFYFLSGNGVIYYLASRVPRNRESLVELFASFCLCGLLLAAVGVFESARSWYLYSEFGGRWTDDLSYGFYLVRGTSLRAKASASTPLELGYLLAISIGFWLFLAFGIRSKLARWSAFALYCLGLLAAYSRGPWLGAGVVVCSYLLVRSGPLKSLFKIASGATVFFVAISLTPFGKKIAAVIPALGGDVDVSNINYRQRLLERCWDVFKESPLFGDQWVYFKMEDLRQGQGIIDFVNTYAEQAVFYGIVGLMLFIAPILIGMIRSYRAARSPRVDATFANIGASVIACIAGTLVMLATTSFFGAYAIIFYFLTGLSSAYSYQMYRNQSEPLPKDGLLLQD
jgi:O-antigen ligase